MDRREFIQLTGISSLTFSGMLPFLSCRNTLPDSRTETVLQERAFLAFKRFKEVWDFNDFWKRGNTFDACLVFVEAVMKRWPNHPQVQQIQADVHEMLEQNLTFFNSVKVEDMWADDFGWWGLMGLNARRFLLKMNETKLADHYWELSNDLCWQYKKSTAYDFSAHALPVAHGCRNGDAAGHSPGVKNTVTNVLLFLLSSRIYRVAKSEEREDTEKYLDMAYRQWLWFTEWFKLEEYHYLKTLSTKEGALVQERPMAEFNGSGYIEKIHPPWAEGWVWSGDQGMLVAAFADMIAVKNDLEAYLVENDLDASFRVDKFEKQALEIIHKIGAGVKNALVADVDGLLREAPCLSSFGPEHGRDYLAGRGIMMRYLADSSIKDLLSVDLDSSVNKTASAIWDTREQDNNQFQPEFTRRENDKLYVEQFRKQWGIADDVHKWNLDKMKEKNKNGVCQAVGLDIIGAAIRTLK